MPSQFLTTCIIVVFSYITQKYISFKWKLFYTVV
jgi:hypothetical protein